MTRACSSTSRNLYPHQKNRRQPSQPPSPATRRLSLNLSGWNWKKSLRLTNPHRPLGRPVQHLCVKLLLLLLLFHPVLAKRNRTGRRKPTILHPSSRIRRRKGLWTSTATAARPRTRKRSLAPRPTLPPRSRFYSPPRRSGTTRPGPGTGTDPLRLSAGRRPRSRSR